MAFSYTQAVRMGAKLLDEQSPGWAYKVKIRDLDMSSDDRCILGFAFGEFADGEDFLWPDRRTLGLDQGDLAERHGFVVADRIRGPVERRVPFDGPYTKLGMLWADQVRQRRGRSGTRGTRKAKAHA